MRRHSLLLMSVSALALGATVVTTVALGGKQQANAARSKGVPTQFRARLTKIAAVQRSTPHLPTQAEVLAAVLQAVPGDDIADAHVGGPPPGFVAAPSLGEIGTAWVYVTVRASNHTDGNVVTYWESSLVAGAFREASHALNLSDVLGYTTTVVNPDATSFGPNAQVIGQPFVQQTLAKTAALDRIRARLAGRPQFVRSSLEVLQPYGAAVRATVWLAPNAKLKRGESAALDVFGDIHDYEGTLLRVVDSSGSIIRITAHSTLTGTGSGWSRPGEGPDGVPLGIDTSMSRGRGRQR